MILLKNDITKYIIPFDEILMESLFFWFTAKIISEWSEELLISSSTEYSEKKERKKMTCRRYNFILNTMKKKISAILKN